MDPKLNQLAAITSRARECLAKRTAMNEAATKMALVEPLLRWLGWNTNDSDEVRPEWRRRQKGEPVDYGLFVEDEPVLLVEAKALRDPLKSDKGWKQAVTNGVMGGFRWCARTNGHRMILFDLLAGGKIEDKVFWDIDLAQVDEASEGALSKMAAQLELASKAALTTGKTEEAWDAEQRWRKAKAAVDAFFAKLPAELVDMIREHSRDADLAANDIRACVKERLSLAARVSKPTTGGKRTDNSTGQSRVTVRDLVSAGIVKAGDTWVYRGKGTEVHVKVEPDGSLAIGNRKFDSPSMAGKHATGWMSCHGWKLWRYKDANGEWRAIDELRQQFAKTGKTAPEVGGAKAEEREGTKGTTSRKPVFKWSLVVRDQNRFVIGCRYLPDETKSFEVHGERVPPDEDFKAARRRLFEEIYEHIKPLFPGLSNNRIRAKAWAGVHKVYPADTYGKK